MDKTTKVAIIVGMCIVCAICICIGCATSNETIDTQITTTPEVTVEPITEPSATEEPIETEEPTSTPEVIIEPVWDTKEFIDANFQDEIEAIAKIVYREARGVKSQTEQACVIWTILNRYDTGKWGASIIEVATAPHQFAYYEDSLMVDDYGRDLKELARDVLVRWYDELHFDIQHGRVLPNDYYYFTGDGKHNYFTQQFKSKLYWDYSLPSPYEASN